MSAISHVMGQVLATASKVAALLIVFFVLRCFYNLFLHPLRSYPGPWHWKATRLVWTYYDLRGELVFQIQALHERYGPVVRIAPTELSYTTAAAWRDIYGTRDAAEMLKDLQGAGLPPPMDEGPGIANAGRADHARVRKLLAPAFSDRALRDYEPVLQKYTKQLVDGLARAAPRGPQDLVGWYNWASFDIVGDLAFGDPFGSLSDAAYHPWVSNIFRAIKSFAWLHVALHYRILPLLRLITPRQLSKAYDDTVALVREKVDRRLATEGPAHVDFVSHFTGRKGGAGLSRREMYVNVSQLIAAGSETTATCLSGATYYLLCDERVYGKLVAAIRRVFRDEANITVQATAEIEYLHAVLEESLRIYPPAAGSMPRLVPGQGAVIDGRWVPGGNTVSVHQLSTYQSPRNFHKPTHFIPERWLEASDPSSPFFNDNRAAFQPFSFGPRNCIGKSLAYAEMRVIIARLLWNFDLELADKGAEVAELAAGRGWKRQQAFLAWEKKPLMVSLRKRGAN